jgi:hypothetical protein
MVISRVFVECGVRKLTTQHNKGSFMFQTLKDMRFKMYEGKIRNISEKSIFFYFIMSKKLIKFSNFMCLNIFFILKQFSVDA